MCFRKFILVLIMEDELEGDWEVWIELGGYWGKLGKRCWGFKGFNNEDRNRKYFRDRRKVEFVGFGNGSEVEKREGF